MSNYLHCFDLSDKLKSVNFCSRRVIESLFSTQLLIKDKKANPRNLSIEKLINCSSSEIDGLSSPRMTIVYLASIARKHLHPQTEESKKLINTANFEIDFERLRRKFNPDAPSRLSCLYLVSNDIDGRMVLQNMFVYIFSRPKVVEVDILNNLGLIKADHNWIDKYLQTSNEDFAKKYWEGEPFDEGNSSWEYLLEGSIMLTNNDEITEIEQHVKDKYPVYYDTILIERKAYKH